MTVVMYTKPGCPYCQSAREDLERAGLAFEERDATTDPAWRAELMEHSRNTAVVPTIVGREGPGHVQVGFPPGRG